MHPTPTILVVDDTPPALKAAARLLEQEGYTVIEASDGAGALARIREFKPDLVLLDVVLPDISGNEVLREVRKDPSLDRVSVVLLSSHQVLSEDQAEGLNAGADGYIARPIANSELLARVHSQFRQRELTEKLRASERQFASAFEYAAIGIALVAPDGRYLKVNRALCDMVGYSEAELLTRSYQEITHPEDQDDQSETRRTLLDGGIPSFQLEKRYLHRDGHVVWAHLSVSLVRDEAGLPLHVISQIQDITKRKLADEALRASEERLRQVMENIHEVFWMIDVELGRMIYISPGYEAIWGRTCECPYTWPGEWLDAVHPDDRHRVGLSAEACLSGGTYDEEYRILRPCGELRWIRDRGFPVKDGAGAVYRVAGVAEDVTARKNLEQQFLRAQRMESIGTLAGGIAHDLNNVLAPIIMSLDLFKLRFPDRSSQDLLSIISASAHRGADMVRQVLSFARGVEGRRMEIRVHHLVAEVAQITGETFPRQISIRTELPDDLRTIIGDPTQLHQVLLNLFLNARDAMPTGGTLSISAENITVDEHYAAQELDVVPGPYVLIQVEDSGTGMPPEIVEKIFDPFFTTKEVGQGTGLGLSTSQAIVKSHGGFLKVYSESGKGTIFKIHLPAGADDDAGVADGVGHVMPRGRDELILVVDDEAPVREITKQTLEAFGYRVLLAGDGAEAVSLYASLKDEIAVVLTDMMMPVMDGPATIQVLRKIHPAVRIIAASGLSAHGHVAQAARLGVTHFLPKPYTAETLLSTLSRVLAAD